MGNTRELLAVRYNILRFKRSKALLRRNTDVLRRCIVAIFAKQSYRQVVLHDSGGGKATSTGLKGWRTGK